MEHRQRLGGLGLAALLLLALPAWAAPERVAAGFDYWQTLGSGATAYSFAGDPLPADFFCLGSAPFAGTIQFEGVPLRTVPDGILGTTDTVIQRLDEAVFDADGVARTRIQGRALNLRGVETLKTSCGSWKVRAGLAGRQPITGMEFRLQHAGGGTFDADLRLRVKITFTHAETGETRSLSRLVSLPTAKSTPFAIGAAALACPQPVQPALVAAQGAGPLRILGGDPIRVEGGNPEVLDLEPTPKAQAVVTGCLCQTPQGPCLPVYSWHNPCRRQPPYAPPPQPGYDCELHFTYTPCQLGYESQCDADEVEASFLTQLRELHQLGYITEDPERVLDRQLGRPEAPERPPREH